MNVLRLCVVGGLVVCASLLALPVTASAQAEDEPFKRGLDARADQKWAEMAEAMQQAITINRTESMRRIQTGIITRRRSSEYFPYYLLGHALKNRNDCAGAVVAWEISEDQKTVLGHPEYIAGLRQGYKDCAAKGVLLREDYRTQVAITDQVYNDTVALATRLERSKGTSGDLWRPEFDGDIDRARNELGAAQKVLVKARQTRMLADFSESRNGTSRAAGLLRPIETRLNAALSTRELIAKQAGEAQQVLAGAETNDRAIDAAKVAMPPDLAASRESARALVRSARDRLAQADKTQNRETAAEGVKLAIQANEGFVKLLEQVNKLARGEFEQRLQQAVAAANDEFSFVGNSLATLERLVAEKPQMVQPAMASERDALVKNQSALQRRFDNARRTENINSVQDVMKLAIEARARIDALIKAFGPATLRDRGVREPLEAGARLYFSGEYQQSLDTLAPLEGKSDVPLQLHAYLFRAASLYALYVRSGETNQALLTAAVAAIQRCKEIDSAFQPSTKAFSPRFIGFFQNPGAAGQSAAAPSQ